MKIIDERETQKKEQQQQQQKTNKDRKEQGETEAIVKGWELHDFVVHLS